MNPSVQFCGIDVAARTLSVAVEAGSGVKIVEMANSPTDHERLARQLTAHGRRARVCMEATGNYHLDLALRLKAHPEIEVMVVNPRRIKTFSDAMAVRSRNDSIDSRTILAFLQRMPFEPWTPPSSAVLELRSLTRRIHDLTTFKTAEKCRLHAATASQTGAAKVHRNIAQNIRQLERQIADLRAYARKIASAQTELNRHMEILVSVPGIGVASAIAILAEIATLPADLTPAQWVAHAALDPRHHSSGASVHPPTFVAKAGNRHLRRALFMPAMCLILRNVNAQAFKKELLARGLTKLQVVVAVMRKLLRCLHGMLRTGTSFNAARFREINA